MDYQKLFINNNWVAGHSGEWIDVLNPYTKKTIAQVPRGDEADVEKAVQAARKAFPSWSKTASEERIRIMSEALENFRQYRDILIDLEVAELGQPTEWTTRIHVDRNYDRYDGFIDIAKAYQDTRTLEKGKVVREPIGVIACLTPWNYPLGQVMQKIIPAILTGNTVILKPSQHTPLSVYYLAQAFLDAGLPAGVFNLVTGKGAEVGDALCTHPEVDMVSFTGSTDAGRTVGRQALSTIKKFALELGGKSPAVLLPGCDLDHELPKVLSSCFNNSGQTCMAFTRLVAPRTEAEAIEDALKRLAADWQAGDPRDEANKLGPLVNETQYEKVKKYIEKGVAAGARMIVGEENDFSDPYLVQPVIFCDVTPDMDIARDEIFGPVLSVQYYDDVAEALAIANDTVYGLVGAVYGPDEDAKAFAREMKAGQIYVNDGERDMYAPFGGYKASGLGREGGLEGFEEYLEIKAIFS